MLPQEEGGAIKLVIPSSLQISWIESPGYFCAASEMERDVREEYTQSRIGSHPDHKFFEYTKGSPEYEALPDVLVGNCPMKLFWKSISTTTSA